MLVKHNLSIAVLLKSRTKLIKYTYAVFVKIQI